MVRLEFVDFVDLQTRLVLLPLIEEEGVGAVVAAYTPKDEKINTQVEQDEKSEMPSQDSSYENDGAKEDTQTDQLQAESSSEGQQQTEEASEAADELPEETHSDNLENKALPEPEEKAPEDQEVVGMILTGIALAEPDKQDVVDCGGKDFSVILASIREAPPPIILVFEPAPEKDTGDNNEEDFPATIQETEESPEDDASTTTSASPDECEVEETRPSTPPRSILGDRLSSWGTRMRATSAILAAEAASSAASIVTAANEASERAKAIRNAEKDQSVPEESSQCSLFLQDSRGKFISLTPPLNPSSTSSQVEPPNVTTSSVLLVRLSASQSCPTRGYEFQWYRSYRTEPSTHDSPIPEPSSKEETEDGETFDGLDWSLLPGANYAAYQPSATDVGHHLRCVVTITKGDSPERSDKEVSNVSENKTNEESKETITCSMRDTVAADASLFSGARQALIRGAKFGNLVGRGKADGRVFRLHIEVSRCPNEESESIDVKSAVTIFQISGNTTEPLHDQPILNATAISDPSRPKDFDLIIPAGAASMVSALSTNERFQLQAPNRITRESLLLALGIANYRGLLADLNTKSILFPGPPAAAPMETGDQGDIEVTPFKAPIADDIQFFTPREASPSTKDTVDTEKEATSCVRIKELEQELQEARSLMASRDKLVSDLHRQLAHTGSNLEKAEALSSSRKAELERRTKECQTHQSSLRSAEREIETLRESIRNLKVDHAFQIKSLEDRISSQSERIADAEKNVRSLQNEKAVLSGAVEAREIKLSKMAELQMAVDNLSDKVSKGDAVKSELNEMRQRYIAISQDLEKVSTFEKECREELQQTRATMEDLQNRLAKEQQKGAARQSQMEALQIKMQKLQAERNNAKQKADSLSKEVSRLCRNGRTLRDVEKIVLDEDSRQMEVSLLKSQKRQALEDLHHYRTAYEQTLMAQAKAGLDGEAMRALEQKAELERVVSDMTEYVSAKEMQLETLKQVNQALTEELHMLAQANMSKNDI